MRRTQGRERRKKTKDENVREDETEDFYYRILTGNWPVNERSEKGSQKLEKKSSLYWRERKKNSCIWCIITSCSVVKDSSKFDTWLSLTTPVCLIGLPHYPIEQTEDCSMSGGIQGGGSRWRGPAGSVSLTSADVSVNLTYVWYVCDTHIHRHTQPSFHSQGPTVGYSLISHTLEL